MLVHETRLVLTWLDVTLIGIEMESLAYEAGLKLKLTSCSIGLNLFWFQLNIIPLDDLNDVFVNASAPNDQDIVNSYIEDLSSKHHP